MTSTIETRGEKTANDLSQHSSPNGFVRYTLKLPKDIHTELTDMASEMGISMLDLLLRIVRLGLWIARETRNSPYAEIVVRSDDGEKTLLPMLN